MADIDKSEKKKEESSVATTTSAATGGADLEANEEEYYDEEYDEGDFYEGSGDAGGNGEAGEEEEEEETLEEMQRRIESLDEELNKISKSQKEISSNIEAVNYAIDEKSVYVGQVDYDATEAELQEHFEPCGAISRVHIVCTKFKKPKGCAYIEFVDKASVENALKYDGVSLFRNRTLMVVPKRNNVPAAELRGGGGGRFGRFGGRRAMGRYGFGGRPFPGRFPGRYGGGGGGRYGGGGGGRYGGSGGYGGYGGGGGRYASGGRFFRGY